MVYKPATSHKVFLQNISDPAWNLCSYCLINREVTFDALEKAMNSIAKDQDALRMSVDDNDNITFFDHIERGFERITFDSENGFLSWAREHSNESVCECPGFWTAYLIDINGRKGIYNIGSHIMCDALNVTNLYQMIVDKLDGKDVAGFSYAGYLERLENYRNSVGYEKDARYWENVLKEEVPVVFPETFDHHCDNIIVRMPDIKGLCDKHDLSEAAAVYALTGILIMRLRGIDALSLGIPTLGRTTQDEMRSLGLFMNNVPMRIRGGKTFLDIVHDTENNLFDLFRHQKFDLPLGKLFDVSVDYSVYPVSEDYASHVIFNDYISTAMEFHYLRSDHLELTVRCRSGLFRNLRSVADSMCKLTESIIVDPYRDISDILIAEFVPDKHQVPVPRTALFQLIQRNSIGKIIEGNLTYSIDDLMRGAEKIDAAVHGKKRVIGVVCDRSFEQLAAIFGIIRGGNAYLPILPDCPEERIRVMLEQSGCDTVLVQKKYASVIGHNALIIEDILSAPAPEQILQPSAEPNDILYVLFTSGSTGVPKGVMISNRSAVNRILWMCRKYFDRDTVVMLKTPYTFDVSVWEIFGFALGGFSLYILPPEDHYRQDRIIGHIVKGSVTDFHFVPTVFSEFLKMLDKKPVSLPSLKNIFLSGEALPAALVNASPAPVHNLYGPTECAVDVTFYDCAETESDPVPIGKPIDNCGVYVLDKNLQPVPSGIEGQICVSGLPVGEGYINDPQLTQEVFVTDPFGEGRLYLTGDIGYWLDDGNIVFVGRIDQQVKINGQRIELGEIEAVMLRFVSPVAVLADNNRLIAYYRSDNEYPGLREELGKVLPRHMIPHSFVRIDDMPYTSGGKIDRKALISLNHKKKTKNRETNTAEEQALIVVIQKVLSLPNVYIDDNFFELGGDSLSAIHVVTELQDQGYYLTIPELLRSETLADAASKIVSNSTHSESSERDPSVVSPIIAAYLREQQGNNINDFTQSVMIPVSADEEEVRRALADVIANHEMLRAVFFENGTFTTGDCGFSFRMASGDMTGEDSLIDIFNGPLLCAVLFPGFLKLTIHHFTVDAVSWSIIVDDLKDSLLHKPLLPEKAAYIDWIHLSADDTDSIYEPHMISPVSGDVSAIDETYHLEIPFFLVRSAAEGAGVRVNELLLAALGVAANDLLNGNAGICVETFGRSDPRFGRTVGWFTDIIPTVINGVGADAIFCAKKTMERISGNVTGFLRLHKRLPDDAIIIYNYLSVPDEFTICGFSPFPGKINVNCLVSGETLAVDIFAPKGSFPRGYAEKLGLAFSNTLTGFVNMNRQEKQTVSMADMYTDSDLTLSEAEEIRRLFDPEDVYSLTPAQLGMYDHWDKYYLRYVLKFDSRPDAARMEASISYAVKRHPVLRSRFQKLSSGSVKQIVIKTVASVFSESDEDIETFLTESHRAEKVSLFAATLVRSHLVIDAHHIIVDGWSLAILAREIKAYYEHYHAIAAPKESFGRFTEWLKERPDGISYWKSVLAGCGVSSDLPHIRSSVGMEHITIQSVFDADVRGFAIRHRVAENTVLEAAFSTLLLKYNHTAAFGKVLSGRNAPIPGIQDIVGNFINIVPVYIADPADVISQIHEQSIMTNVYGFTPLSEMYAQTDLKRINILFVFDNYPLGTQLELAFSEEQTEFDISFSIRKTDDVYLCSVSYAPEKYDRETMEKMLNDYVQTVMELMDGKNMIISSDTKLRQYSVPVDDTEAEICRQFGAIVDQERVGRDDNYYDLGGTSLGLMEMLSRDPLSALTPSEFMSDPTPAGLAKLLKASRTSTVMTMLYEPRQPYDSGIILFSYAGGDAAAYTALIAEFRKCDAPIAVYYVPWLDQYETAASEIRELSERLSLSFYSHCAGCVTAMKLLDILNSESAVIQRFFAAGSIPPVNSVNIWKNMSDEMILTVLGKAGMPDLPDSQLHTLVADFRSNTTEYFSYLQNKTAKTPISVSLIISRKDIFTPDYASAADSWERYVQSVDCVKLIDAPTHYFQSTHAKEIANILLSGD